MNAASEGNPSDGRLLGGNVGPAMGLGVLPSVVVAGVGMVVESGRGVGCVVAGCCIGDSDCAGDMEGLGGALLDNPGVGDAVPTGHGWSDMTGG